MYCKRAFTSYEENRKQFAYKFKHPTKAEKWRLENPKEALKYVVPDGTSEKESHRIRNAEYKTMNPEIIAVHSRNHRAKMKTADIGEYLSEMIILRAHGLACHICNGEIDFTAPRHQGNPGWEYSLHFDHVIPLSKGGTHTIRNVKPAHGICNSMKGNKYPFHLDAMPTI